MSFRLLLFAVTVTMASQIFWHFRRLKDLRELILFQEVVMVEPSSVSVSEKESSLSLPPRLEFFHLPKSGGTYIEQLAGHHNVTWGACHFKAVPLQSKNKAWKDTPPWPHCPSYNIYNQTFPGSGINYWHIPLHMMSRYIDFDPYDIVHPSVQKRPKRFFTVVRNPYDRMISLYYYYKGYDQASEVINNATRMNEFILDTIGKTACPKAHACLHENDYASCHGLFTCGSQYDYIFDNDKQIIHHVLHYETLQGEFQHLSMQYNLNFTIQDRAPVKKKRLLTAANLSDDSIRFINEQFRNDFEFGYKMLEPRSQQKSKAR